MPGRIAGLATPHPCLPLFLSPPPACRACPPPACHLPSDRYYLRRFLRARQHDLPRAKAMFMVGG
jgi:hypothetical protein